MKLFGIDFRNPFNRGKGEKKGKGSVDARNDAQVRRRQRVAVLCLQFVARLRVRKAKADKRRAFAPCAPVRAASAHFNGQQVLSTTTDETEAADRAAADARRHADALERAAEAAAPTDAAADAQARASAALEAAVATEASAVKARASLQREMELVEAVRALIAVQSLVRGELARRAARQAARARFFVETTAAIVLQARIRQRLAQLRFRRHRRAALTLQVHQRHQRRRRAKSQLRLATALLRRAARRAAERRLAVKHAAISLLQNVVRARAARRARARRDRRACEQRGALCIQAAARGRAARRVAALRRRVRAYDLAAAARAAVERREVAVLVLRAAALDAHRALARASAAEEAACAALAAAVALGARSGAAAAAEGWRARQAARDTLDAAQRERLRCDELAFLRGLQHEQSDADARMLRRPHAERVAEAAAAHAAAAAAAAHGGRGAIGIWPGASADGAALGLDGGGERRGPLRAGAGGASPMPLVIHSMRQPPHAEAAAATARALVAVRVRTVPAQIRFSAWDGCQCSARVEPADEPASSAGGGGGGGGGALRFSVALGAGGGSSALWRARRCLRWADSAGTLHETTLVPVRAAPNEQWAPAAHFRTAQPFAPPPVPPAQGGGSAAVERSALTLPDWTGRLQHWLFPSPAPDPQPQPRAAALADDAANADDPVRAALAVLRSASALGPGASARAADAWSPGGGTALEGLLRTARDGPARSAAEAHAPLATRDRSRPRGAGDASDGAGWLPPLALRLQSQPPQPLRKVTQPASSARDLAWRWLEGRNFDELLALPMSSAAPLPTLTAASSAAVQLPRSHIGPRPHSNVKGSVRSGQSMERA